MIESELLAKKGKEAYLNQDPQILKILERLQIMPVQRNKGIDGFLKTKKSFKPSLWNWALSLESKEFSRKDAVASLQFSSRTVEASIKKLAGMKKFARMGEGRASRYRVLG